LQNAEKFIILQIQPKLCDLTTSEVIFTIFQLAHERLRYISASGNNSDTRFRLGDPDFL